MIAYILWFVVLLGICKWTRGWGRFFAVALYLIGTLAVGL